TTTGNFVTIQIGSRDVCEVFTGFGQRGVRAETVAADALDQAQQYLAADVPVGPHLADQLLLPFALAGGGSFKTMALTMHSQTNIDVIGQFLKTRIGFEQTAPNQWTVSVG